MDLSSFSTTRDEVVDTYESKGRSYRAETRKLRSRLSIHWDIVDAQAGTDVAYAVARKGQVLEFFGYKVGDSIPTGIASGQTKAATELDTNLTTARRIIGDAAIETIAFSRVCHRVAYAAGAGASTADPIVKAALLGQVAIHDPAAIVAPRQAGAPYNSEDALYQAIIASVLVNVDFGGGDRKIKLGTMLEMPSADARSFLTANGCCENIFTFKEGIRLTDDQSSDRRDFVVQATLAADVVVPINTVMLNGGETLFTPTAIATELECRLGGLYLKEGAGTC